MFVLVHGSWHWGGCFQKVADRLAAAGHAVATPDLASHGYDPTPWQSVDSMATYTAPLVKLLRQIDGPVTLVGHSMGGVTLSYLAETLPEKIAKLVYLTAFMTPPGKSANDYIFSYAANPTAASLFAVLNPVEGGAGLELLAEKADAVRDAFYGDVSDADFAVAQRNAVRINTSVPNVWTPKSTTALERHYVTCSQDHAIPYDVQHQMVAEAPGAKVHAMTASHSPFFSKPDELAVLLSGL